MGVLLFWISRTRIVDFLEILTRTRCRLASRSLAVSNFFLGLTIFWSLIFSSRLVHSWKAHYSAACLSVAVQRTSSVHRMSYSSLLELDERIRSFPLPSYLHSPMHGARDWDATPSRALQQFFAGNQRESSESLLPVYFRRVWPAHNNARRIYRPFIHPQVLVRRGVTRLVRSTPARVWSICSCDLSQRQYLDQWHEKSHRRAS